MQVHIPKVLKTRLESVKGWYNQLQPWFIVRRVSWLYTNGSHKDYKGDWLHRGLLHSFWRWEILVWNLVLTSPEGQFSHRYAIPMVIRHVVQSSLKMKDGISFFFKMQSVRPIPCFFQLLLNICNLRAIGR